MCDYLSRKIKNTWIFLNMLLEEDEKDQLDRSCEKSECTTRKQGEKECPICNKMKESRLV
jgi:hypothetical protein